ncbi:MAG: hypothetical protein A2W68_19705 [Betaproteobacteria bacterium RIFCSPLOWO2_02_64_14]|nr:MAG: hypothetical protein A2W68_19705 [Betaproteobacteria bacterium RIFCSPLOWO2_02_64_14]
MNTQSRKENAMNAKKTVCMLSAGAALAVAIPVFADPPHWAPAHGYRHKHERVVVVERRYRPVVREVIVERPVYIRRRPVVVYEEPAYYAAPPAAVTVRGNVLGTLGGAIIGAAVGSQIGHGDGRTAATAVGAVVGGTIGSGL